LRGWINGGNVAGECQEIGQTEYLDAVAGANERRSQRAQAARAKPLTTRSGPAWLTVHAHVVAHPKDPLFLASSLFVTKPERIVALSLVMMRCLLVYRLGAHRLREPLAATAQTGPNAMSKPTVRPKQRWKFSLFAGVSLVTFPQPSGPPQQELAGLEPLDEQMLALLGPASKKRYKPE
jgi:hypothetical protein